MYSVMTPLYRGSRPVPKRAAPMKIAIGCVVVLGVVDVTYNAHRPWLPNVLEPIPTKDPVINMQERNQKGCSPRG